MTQLVNKASSWRTLRRKVVVGASSLALVAGMGVALAPSAAAAGELAVGISGVDSAIVSGTAGTGVITVKNVSGQDLGPGNLGQTNSKNNVAAIQISASGAGLVNAKTVGTLTALGVTTPNGSVDVLAGTPAGGSTLTSAYQAVVNANVPLGAVNPIPAPVPPATNLQVAATTAAPGGLTAWTGDLTFTVKFVVVSSSDGVAADGTVVRELGSATFKTAVAKASDPAFVETSTGVLKLSAGLAQAFEANVVDSFGVPEIDPAYDKADKSKTVAGSVSGVIFADGAAATANSIAPVDGDLADDHDGGVTYEIGNGFYFNAETGKVTAKAGAVTQLGTVASKWVHFHQGGDVIEISITVSFADAADINPEFLSAVNWAIGTTPKVAEGDANGKFNPAASVTRGQFAGMLYRAMGTASAECSGSATSGFADVANSSPFCTAIAALADKGIINGVSDTQFNLGGKITRAQISTMLYRAAQVKSGNTPVTDHPAAACTTAPFGDVAADFWACGEINWASSTGIVKGGTDGNFNPGADSTRQVSVTFLQRSKNAGLL